MSIIDWLVKLFGGNKIDAHKVGAAQYDGWVPPNAPGKDGKGNKQSAGFDMSTVLLLGGAVFLATQMGKDSEASKD